MQEFWLKQNKIDWIYFLVPIFITFIVTNTYIKLFPRLKYYNTFYP